MNKIKWGSQGVEINGKREDNFRYADQIITRFVIDQKIAYTENWNCYYPCVAEIDDAALERLKNYVNTVIAKYESAMNRRVRRCANCRQTERDGAMFTKSRIVCDDCCA